MKTSDQINELAGALAKAQGEIGKAKQSQEAVVPMKKGGQYSYGYATLADIWDACRKPLSDNGIAVMQAAETIEGGVEITTLLAHSSGQWASSQLVFVLEENDPQAIGSALTYGRRYGLAAIVGIAPAEDDDGQAAKGIKAHQTKEVVDKTQHWCEEHQATFFKRGTMKGYAHPIKDSNNQTIGWCNEPTDSLEAPQTSTQGQQVGSKPKVDTRLMEPRYTELVEAIRNSVLTGSPWDGPLMEAQWANLRGHFGDKAEAIFAAIWGEDNEPTAGQAGAIFNAFGKTGQERKDAVAKLLRLADEGPKNKSLFDEEETP